MAQLQTTAVTGSLTVTGQIIAQTLNVQQVTSSIVYSSGSNRFGNLTSDVQQFTGSLRVTGSGNHYIVGGNVGIGTVSPGVPLHIVNGAVTPSGGYSVIDLAIEGTNESALGIIGTTYSSIYFGDAATVLAGAIVYDHSSDDLNFRTNGNVERMRITSAGSVGIGTSSPVQRLDVSGSIRVVSTGTYSDPSDNAGLINYDNASGVFTISARSSGGSTYLALRTSNAGTGAERVRITNDGNLGIGTTSPQSPLHIYRTSDAYITVQNASGNYSYIQLTDGSSNAYLIKNNTSGTSNGALAGALYTYTDNNKAFQHVHSGTALFTILSGGNVGIGTTAPTAKLYINSSTGGEALYISTTSGSTAVINPFTALHVGQNTIQIHQFGQSHASAPRVNQIGVSNAEQHLHLVTDTSANVVAGTSTNGIFLRSGGSVGIGTTAPKTVLDVYSNTDIWHFMAGGATSKLLVAGQDPTGVILQGGAGSSTNNAFVTSPYNIILQRDGGNVGIGTTSIDTKLHVYNGSAGTISSYDSTGITIENSGRSALQFLSPANSDAYILFGAPHASGLTSNRAYIGYDHPTDIMYLYSTGIYTFSGGSVGIGTTSPGVKLDVVGYGRFTSTNANVSAVDGTIITKVQSQTVGATQGAIGTESNNNLAILTNNTVRALVTTAGNVGINTTSPTARLQVSGSSDVLNVKGSGSLATSSLFSVDGAYGRLFEVSDDLSNSLFSVNTIAGLPVIEAFADYSVNLGTYSAASGSTMRVTGSRVGIGTTSPTALLQIGDGNTTHASSRGFLTLVGKASDWNYISFYSGATYKSYIGYDSSGYNQWYSVDGVPISLLNANVGIGTTAPAYKLDVAGYGYFNNVVYFGASNLKERAYVTQAGARFNYNSLNLLDISVQNGITYIYSNYYGGGSDQPISIGTYANYTNQLYLATSGNVGIGTTSPQAKLQVVGTSTFSQSATTYGGTVQSVLIDGNGANAALTINATSDYAYLNFAQAGTTKFEIGIEGAATNKGSLYINHNIQVGSAGAAVFIKKSDGNVGVGTLTPTAKLHINNASTASTSMLVGNNNGGSYFGWDSDSAVLVASYISSPIKFGGSYFSSFTEWMRITTTGNVGIGTTSPQAKLQIEGNNIILNTENSAQLKSLYFRFSNEARIQSDSYFTFYTGGSPTEKMRITSDGNVGIGTTAPSRQLELYGNDAYLQLTRASTAYQSTLGFNTGTTNDWLIRTGDGSTSNLQFYSYGNSSYVMTILRANGNVGIGTTSPVYKLDVNGNIAAGTGTGNEQGVYIRAGSTASDYANIRFYHGGNNINTIHSFPALWQSGTIFTTSANSINIQGNAGVTFGSWPSVDVVFVTGGINYFKGNVGIGSTSPAYKLDVTGNGRFTSTLTSGARIQAQGSNGAGTTQGGFWINYNSNANSRSWLINNDYNVFGDFVILQTTTQTGDTFDPKLYIKNDGNVGIGTTAPTRKFQVQGTDVLSALVSFNETSTTADRYSQLEFVAGSRTGYIWLANENSTSWAGAGGLNIYTTNGNMDFWTNTTQKVRITTGGSFLMGDVTTTPSEAAWFGTGVFGKNGTNKVILGYLGSSTNGAVIGGHNSALTAWAPLNIDGSELRFNIQESRAVTINASGNVGIGSTSPSYKFQSNGPVGDWAGYFKGSTTANQSYGMFIDAGTSASDSAFMIRSADITSTFIRVLGNGNVGIGTTTPNATFNIVTPSADTTGDSFIFKGSNAKEFVSISKLGFIRSRASDSNGANMHFFDNSGNKRVEVAVSTTAFSWYSDALASNFLTFQHSTGNIGIGTTSPIATLHVQGTTVISGSLNLSGSAIGLPEHMVVALSDETTNITAGTARVTFRAPFAMRLTDIPRASLTTASTSGLVTVDINESGTSVLGANKLSIDANELTSTTAATPTTIADALIADDAQITMDIDGAGTGAKGLKVTLYYIRT